MARMVPIGIDFWASRKSPERLEPAMMPVRKQETRLAMTKVKRSNKKKVLCDYEPPYQ